MPHLKGKTRGDVKWSFHGGNDVFCHSPIIFWTKLKSICPRHLVLMSSRRLGELSEVSFSLPRSSKYLNRDKWWFSSACCRCFWIQRYFHGTWERAQFSAYRAVPSVYRYYASLSSSPPPCYLGKLSPNTSEAVFKIVLCKILPEEECLVCPAASSPIWWLLNRLVIILLM